MLTSVLEQLLVDRYKCNVRSTGSICRSCLLPQFKDRIFDLPSESTHKRRGMSLPEEYIDIINKLNNLVLETQPIDVLQYCANYFNGLLEEERAATLNRSQTPTMTNPFASMRESEGPSSGPFGGESTFGMTSHYDGTRDAIREEDEDIQSPTSPSFRPHHHGSSSSSSRRRSRSPTRSSGAGRSSGGGRSPGGGSSRSSHHGSHHPSRSPFQSPAGSHLSPNSAQGEFPSNYNRNRRTSVSAESLVPAAADDEWTPPVHPKTPEQQERLVQAVANNFLFAHLDEEQSSQVLAALVEKPVPAKDTRIITQGDVGDYFYIVEKGHLDVYVNEAGRMMPGPDGAGKKVNSIGPGGSFGELALMYNAPRAATVASTTPHCVLWALDRVTFRRILMEDTFKKRRMYEAFLEEVSILSSLVAYERSKIADALETATFEPGDVIIKQGDPGDRFYILEQGEAEVTKDGKGYVGVLTKGAYFGELALLNDEPRAANIIAKTKVKVAFLGKDGFQRLLGPVVDIMRRNDPRLAESVDPHANIPRPSGFEESSMNRPIEA